MRNIFGTAAFAALLALIAPANAEAGLKVFACVPEWGVLAKAIGGDAVEVTTATSPFDSPEQIRPTPALIADLQAQLARRMIELDPENEAAYGDRARKFIGDLSAAKKELEAQAAPLRGIAVAVQHDHSSYLIDWLGIRSVLTIEPEHFVRPGPARLGEIIDSVPRQDIKIIVYGVFDDPAPSRFVGEKSGSPVVMLPYTVGGTPAATDFITFYRDSVERLLSGLNGVGRS